MDTVARIQADRPIFHVGGTVRWDSLPETLEMISRSVKDGHHTLETGCGASTVVFAAGGAFHTAISPDASEHERVRDYCRSIGVDDSRLTFITGLSDDVLPEICKERTIDVAFIDGAHSFPHPEVDWHYVTKALKVGAILLIDDIPVPAVEPLFRHMNLEPNWRFEAILDNRAAAFSMLAPPAPEEWSAQPFNKRYPDYSFAPLLQRAKLIGARQGILLRRRAGERYPDLRDKWKKLSGKSSH